MNPRFAPRRGENLYSSRPLQFINNRNPISPPCSLFPLHVPYFLVTAPPLHPILISLLTNRCISLHRFRSSRSLFQSLFSGSISVRWSSSVSARQKSPFALGFLPQVIALLDLDFVHCLLPLFTMSFMARSGSWIFVILQLLVEGSVVVFSFEEEVRRGQYWVCALLAWRQAVSSSFYKCKFLCSF